MRDIYVRSKGYGRKERNKRYNKRYQCSAFLCRRTRPFLWERMDWLRSQKGYDHESAKTSSTHSMATCCRLAPKNTQKSFTITLVAAGGTVRTDEMP